MLGRNKLFELQVLQLFKFQLFDPHTTNTAQIV
jgi:hypothetical protein